MVNENENWQHVGETNNMDVEAMGNLATVDTVFIDYPTNDIFKVNFKDAGFWNSFFDQYNSLDWKISSINQLNDSLTGLVVKSISNNIDRNQLNSVTERQA